MQFATPVINPFLYDKELLNKPLKNGKLPSIVFNQPQNPALLKRFGEVDNSDPHQWFEPLI